MLTRTPASLTKFTSGRLGRKVREAIAGYLMIAPTILLIFGIFPVSAGILLLGLISIFMVSAADWFKRARQ